MRSNPVLKSVDKLLGRCAFALLRAHEAVRRLIVRRYRAGTQPDSSAVVAIKLCCLGDGILAVPALRSLKTLKPDARLIVVCTPRSSAAFESLPFVDELHVLPITGIAGIAEVLRNGLQALPILRGIRRQRPAIAVDLDLYYRATPVIAYLTGAPLRVGFDTEGCNRAGLFTASAPRDPIKWELECFLDVVRLLGAPTDDKRLEFPITDEASAAADRALRAAGLAEAEPFIALCPGSSKNWPTKQWPAERFAQVADWARERHGLRAVLIGAPFEQELCARVAAAASSAVINLAGKTTVQETAAVLARSRALVTNDTGPMHLATAVGTPVVAIFGPTDERKWGPRGPRDITITHENCDCRPCYRLSYMPDCPHRRCLMELPAERVVAGLSQILGASPLSS